MVRMGLESCGVRTPTSREQEILHRVRRIHVPTLRHMVSVNGLLLLLLLLHPRVHMLVLLGPTCIWRSLTKVFILFCICTFETIVSACLLRCTAGLSGFSCFFHNF